MPQDQPPWVIAMYASIGSRARMLRAFLNPDAEAVASAEEATHLRRAAEHLEAAEREVAALVSTEARTGVPRDAYGTYLGDEIGALLMRIEDYAETIGGAAAGMHGQQKQLSQREEQVARKVELLLAEAFVVLGG
jgi:hypothetical protein